MHRAVMITGNARTDHTLLALTRLLADIAANGDDDTQVAQQDAYPGADEEVHAHGVSPVRPESTERKSHDRPLPSN
jgi:hypothetical protein